MVNIKWACSDKAFTDFFEHKHYLNTNGEENSGNLRSCK